MSVEEQDELINLLGWDYLVVLDACRYDYFEEECPFKGELKRARSPAFEGEGAPTSVWYRNVFQKDYDDVIHISSHPRVNSKLEVEGFDAKKHFSTIIDLWDQGWDEKMGTVLPERVTSRALEEIEKHPGKRFVIHYMQPHTPYLSLGPPTTKKKKDPDSRTSLCRRFRNKLVSTARNLIGDKTAVDLMGLLRLPPLSPMDDALRRVGVEGVKEAYRENLIRALESVKELVGSVDGEMVITADHGELLGEGGRFGHDLKPRKELVEVPWFELSGD